MNLCNEIVVMASGFKPFSNYLLFLENFSFLYYYDIFGPCPLCDTPPSFPLAFLIIKKERHQETHGLIIITIIIIKCFLWARNHVLI